MTDVDLAAALWLLLAALGLALAVSYAGLPVLGQGAFVTIGAVGTALLGPGGAGWPLGLAVALSVVVAGVLGHLVALAAARLEGAFLALATWGLAWLAYRLLLAFPSVFGGVQGLVRPSPAHLVTPVLGLDVVLTPAVHVVVAAAFCGAAVLALVRVERGPGGLDLAALREGPVLARSLGIPVAARRRTVISVAAAIGALSGAGTFVLLGLVAPADVSPLLSLQLFVAVLVGGAARWWGPVVGVAALTGVPHLVGGLPAGASRGGGILTALLLLAVLMTRRLLPTRTQAATDGGQPGAPPTAPSVEVGLPTTHPVLLHASGLSASYGGLLALDQVSVSLGAGTRHALIGPNGSGKTTLLRVLAGDLRPARGQIEIAGVGVVRTPQRTTLLPRLSVRRQVAMGRRGGSPAALSVLRDLLATPRARRDAQVAGAAVDAVLDITSLRSAGPRSALALPVGEQRLLQVARAVATGSRVLLLDEPAAGMTARERVRLGAVLRALAGNGCAVLLVEHDMRLVRSVADVVTVLDAGRVLAVGAPDVVAADAAVRRVYLGDVPA